MGGVERQGQLEGGVVFVGVAAPVSAAPQPLSADGASALHFAYPRTNDVAVCREHEQSFGNAEVLLCCGAGRCNRRGSNERSAAAIGADFEFGLKSNKPAASGADAATSFGVVDDLSVWHIWFC